jgi:YggT family protein
MMVSHIAGYVYSAFTLLVLANVLLSWFPKFRWHPVGRIVFNLTEPMLRPFRRILPLMRLRRGTVAMDFSPVLLLLAGWIVCTVLVQLLKSMGIL